MYPVTILECFILECFILEVFQATSFLCDSLVGKKEEKEYEWACTDESGLSLLNMMRIVCIFVWICNPAKSVDLKVVRISKES